MGRIFILHSSSKISVEEVNFYRRRRHAFDFHFYCVERVFISRCTQRFLESLGSIAGSW